MISIKAERYVICYAIIVFFILLSYTLFPIAMQISLFYQRQHYIQCGQKKV